MSSRCTQSLFPYPTEVVLQDLVVVLLITSTIFPKWHYATGFGQTIFPNGTTSGLGCLGNHERNLLSLRLLMLSSLYVLCNSERLIAAARPV
jgi:hypothetical protein